jgi:hypothetical protein
MRLASALIPAILAHAIVHIRAVDVRLVQVTKSVKYLQSGTGAAVLQPTPCEFRARVDLTRQDSVNSVSVKWPAPVNATRSLTNYNTHWEYTQRYTLSDAMNLANPNGTYTIYLQAEVDGNRTNVVTLSADVYPGVVHIANFGAAQGVNAKNDFTLQWDPLGLGPNDFIQVRVFLNDQPVFETGSVPGLGGALSGSATSVVIPQNTLRDATVYRAQVIASRRSTSDATGYPGVPAIAMYSRLTEISLRTVFPTLDVSWYGTAKLKRFTQNSVLAPSPATSGGYAFTAFAVATDPLNLQSALIKPPNAASRSMAAAGANWNWTDSFETQSQLDTAYGSGSYEINLQTTHNGLLKPALLLPSPVYPGPIQISNWHEASAIDATKPFSLKWLPLANGGPDDFIQVIVKKAGQTVFRSPDRPQAGALDGRATSVTFPAGLLLPGESADVTLTFLKAISVDLFSYPQAIGTAASGSESHATIRARGGNLAAPILSGARLQNDTVEFNISAVQQGRQQVIQISPDLRNWTDLFITNAPDASFLFRFKNDRARRAAGLRVLAN